jgi:YggT family protein
MSFIMNLVGILAGLYLLVVFIRVILSWFKAPALDGPMEVLARLTDPYLDWWRRFPIFRAGSIDFSPIAAMVALSLVRTVCGIDKPTVGILLAAVLQALWSVLSSILGFFIIILVLRLIAYLTSRNTYSSFWRTIDSISQPVLYRITRIFYRRRLINYLAGVLLSIGVLAALEVGGTLLINLLSGFFIKLPF